MRRAEERVLVDRVMWLAHGVAQRPGARDRVAQAVEARGARAKTAVNKTELDTAQRQLLAADIKRFLERPLDLARPFQHAAPDAPPGAPIGDPGQDWLAPSAGLGRLAELRWNWDYWEELPPM